MKIRNRILYLHQSEDKTSKVSVAGDLDDLRELGSRKSLYDCLLDELHEAIRCKLGRSEGFPTWPNGAWCEGDFECHVSSWRAEEFIDERLAQIKFVEHVGDVTWALNITLGSYDFKQVIIQEECETLPARHPLPVADAPTLLTFLARYSCDDADQFTPGKVIRLAKNRAPAFLDFVKAPTIERCLPIILVTPRHADGEYALQNMRGLALHLSGMAHVVVLANEARWYPDDLSLNPATFNGAVRLYMPGYEEGQGSSIHRLWMPDRIEELGEARVVQEIVRLVHERNVLQAYENETIRDLKMAREKEIIRKKIEVEVQVAREVEKKRIQQEYDVLRQRLKSQAEAEAYIELEALFDKLQQENQILDESLANMVADKERLEVENRKLRDEIRALNFRLRQRWTEPERAFEEHSSLPKLYLSSQAWEVYNGLDNGLRLLVENQLWQKLCDAPLRNSQSEVVTCEGGACYVFPRSRNADGKRVVYILDGERVKVCELFMNHDQYDPARTRGFELRKYQEFAPWEPVKLQLAA